MFAVCHVEIDNGQRHEDECLQRDDQDMEHGPHELQRTTEPTLLGLLWIVIPAMIVAVFRSGLELQPAEIQDGNWTNSPRVERGAVVAEHSA